MRFLRTNTAIRLTVGPFLDKTDGITPETALTVTSEKLTLMVDDGNVPTLVLDVAPTASGGSNDMVHVTGDDAGFYDLELAAANVNYLGRAMLAITDAATHCPVFHEFMILPAMVYDSLVLGTDTLQADVTQWLGTAAATPTVAGVPEVDVTHWIGTAAATPTVAGVPEVDVTHLLGTGWLTPAVAGTPDVNAKQISGDGTAADNLETMLDGTGGQTLSLGRLVVAYDVGGGAGLAAVSISATNGTSGTGVAIAGVGTSAGMSVSGGATGNGLSVVGGGTSGDGVKVTTTSGHGVNLAPVGTDKHGLFTTGGNGGTSDGIKAVAGTGGVPIRGDLTGNITGNLSGSVGSVTGAVGSVTGAVGSVTGNVGGNVAGSVGSVTGAVGSVTGNVGGNVVGTVASVVGAVGSVTGAVGSVTGNVGGNVTGTIGGLTAAALADFFDTDSGTTYASAVAGSVVKEIADNASGGGGSTTVPQIIGAVTKSGSTYYVTYALLLNGALQTSGLGTLSVTFRDEDGTDLTFSGTPTAAASGLIYASGTLTTAVTDNRPVMVVVAVTKSAVAYSTVLPAVSIA